jgi:hypothetical protein
MNKLHRTSNQPIVTTSPEIQFTSHIDVQNAVFSEYTSDSDYHMTDIVGGPRPPPASDRHDDPADLGMFTIYTLLYNTNA